MGCCISTNKPPKQNPDHHHHSSPESGIFHAARAPPPVEEETVKEVLSETAVHKPIVTPHSPEVQEENIIEPKPVMINTPVEVSEVSEVSEMYSVSGSFSTTVTERDEEVMSLYNGEVKHRLERSSPAKVPRKRPYSGELAGGKERRVRSPAKRMEPSVEKRSHITSRGGQVTPKKRNVGTTGIRRDSGEISGRRSRSPVPRAEGGATRDFKGGSQGQALKVTGRVGGPSPAVAEKSCDVEKSNGGGLTAAQESLENPLVSLECFIFL